MSSSGIDTSLIPGTQEASFTLAESIPAFVATSGSQTVASTTVVETSVVSMSSGSQTVIASLSAGLARVSLPSSVGVSSAFGFAPSSLGMRMPTSGLMTSNRFGAQSATAGFGQVYTASDHVTPFVGNPVMGSGQGRPGFVEKPEKFAGKDFKLWQQKMKFYLTTLYLDRFLTEPKPALSENADFQQVAAVDAWKQSDYLCRNFIMNSLENALYGVYAHMETAKDLWDALDKKYRVEDGGHQQFIATRFLHYQMVDTKSVMEQVHELQVLFHEMDQEGLTMSESFKVACVRDKLPASWNGFKEHILYKKKPLTLDALIQRIRIKEDTIKDQNTLYKESHGKAKAHMVEDIPYRRKTSKGGSSSAPKKHDGKLSAKGGIGKKFPGKCYR